MLKIIRTDASNPGFISLVQQLDAYLALADGSLHSFYHQYNGIGDIRRVVLAYENDKPVACGAIKEYEPGIMEVKRMFTIPESRGRGIAAKVLAELEKWAIELSCHKCILETGLKEPDAIRFYHKNGYHRIRNYGQYLGVENSVCFEKEIG